MDYKTALPCIFDSVWTLHIFLLGIGTTHIFANLLTPTQL